MRVIDGFKCAGLALALAAGTAAPAQNSDSDSIPATGVFKTGQELYDACTSDDTAEVDECYWYIMGVFDSFGYVADVGDAERVICTDGPVKVGDLTETVVSFLEVSDRKYSAVSMVRNALANEYACY